ncbi:hypothetical protein ACTI_30470 [Actinoplanes sp. OR16]|nr:hypothetical protein ACTI_30470 [Actinoplanes sp. OR16]
MYCTRFFDRSSVSTRTMFGRAAADSMASGLSDEGLNDEEEGAGAASVVVHAVRARRETTAEATRRERDDTPGRVVGRDTRFVYLSLR